MNVDLTGLKNSSMMKLMSEKHPKIINIQSQPSLGTTVLLKTTPVTAEMPKPVKNSALTRTPSLKKLVMNKRKAITYSVP